MPGQKWPNAQSIPEFYAQQILLYMMQGGQKAPRISDIMEALQMPEEEVGIGVGWLIENDFIEFIPPITPHITFARRFNERTSHGD